MNRGRRPKWDRTELRAAVSMVPTMASRITFMNMSKAMINVPQIDPPLHDAKKCRFVS
jgi:hypothetical protein